MESSPIFTEEIAAAAIIEQTADENTSVDDSTHTHQPTNGHDDSGVNGTPNPSSSGHGADAHPVQDSTEGLSLYERIYNRYTLIFLMAMTNFWLFFDRGALTSMIMDIRNDKEIAGGENTSLTETEVSAVVSAYMIGFAISGPICASLGRVVNARYIMSTGLFICIGMTFLTGYATSFTMLLAVRAVSGLGEAAVGSYFMTMVDNVATPKTRTMWIGVYMLALPLGIAIGTVVSGNIAASAQSGERASWRLSFYVCALMTIPFAILVMLYPSRFSPTSVGVKSATNRNRQSREVPSHPTDQDQPNSPLLLNANPSGSLNYTSEQGQSSTQKKNDTSDAGNKIDHQSHAKPIDAFKRLITNKLYMCIVFGMGAFMLVIGGKSLLVQPMLRFGPWKLTQTQSSTLSAITAVPSVLGSVAGGVLLDRFGGSAGSQGLFRCCRHLATMICIAVPISVVSLFVYNIYGYVLLQIASTMVMMTIIAPSTAAILSAVDKDVRTYAMSYAIIIERLIALPGPTIVGFLADQFSDGCHSLKFEYSCTGVAPPTPSAYTNETSTTRLTSESDTLTTTVSDVTSGLLSFMYAAFGNSTNDTDETAPSPIPTGDSYRSELCVWVPGKQGSNGSCQNEFEARNAIAFFCTFYVVCIIGWIIATIIAYRKVRADSIAAKGSKTFESSLESGDAFVGEAGIASNSSIDKSLTSYRTANDTTS